MIHNIFNSKFYFNFKTLQAFMQFQRIARQWYLHLQLVGVHFRDDFAGGLALAVSLLPQLLDVLVDFLQVVGAQAQRHGTLATCLRHLAQLQLQLNTLLLQLLDLSITYVKHVCRFYSPCLEYPSETHPCTVRACMYMYT